MRVVRPPNRFSRSLPVQLSSLELRRRRRLRDRLALAPLLAALATLAASACRPARAERLPFPLPALAADSSYHARVADGLARHTYRLARLPDPQADDTLPGPWMVQVLEADRRRCWSPFPYRAELDPGRAPLSALARNLLANEAAPSVVGGVNADFFLFAPNGVLQGPHVHRGTVVAGPGDRAVVALDSAGRLHLTRLRSRGLVAASGDTLLVTGWNHWVAAGLAWYDESHGRIDSVRASAVLELAPTGGQWAIARIDSAPSASARVPRGGALLVLGRNAPPALRERVLAFARGHSTLDTAGVSLAPIHPMQAVGGHGILLRAGTIPAAVDSTGGAGFARARHPRTAVGWDASGQRLLLVTVDGRQPGYSAGATLRELARIMRALGATEAMNLDGGGSTTMVLGRTDASRTTTVETLNRPSDKGGERSIANALMIARRCTP